MGKRILVCGGRDYNSWSRVCEVLDAVHAKCCISVIIQGGAKGADTLAKEWAKSRKIGCIEYPANWNKYGKSAGFRRNRQMLIEGKPEGVVAFSGGVGTAMMVKLARDARIKVMEIE